MNQIKKKNLKANSIELRPLSENDYSDEYLMWLENEEINRYLETRWEAVSYTHLTLPTICSV